MFSVINFIPEGFQPILSLKNEEGEHSHLVLYQKESTFIGAIAIPALYGKEKFFLKMSKITPEYVKKTLTPIGGFTMEEFYEFDNHITDLSLSVLNILKNPEKYTDSAILIMKPAHIVTIFLAAGLMMFMSDTGEKSPTLYSLAQLLQFVYGKFQEKAKKKIKFAKILKGI
jgi:hypothetical protein